MKKEPKKRENARESTVKRDEKGLWLPGTSPNPAGKPPGTLSITALIKQKLEQEALTTTGEKKKYVLLLIESMLNNAIKKGDHNAQKMIWNYIDGMPKGSLDLTTKGQKINTFDPAQVQRIAKEVLENKDE